MAFDAKEHLINLNRDQYGNEREPARLYLPVAKRLIWFRDEHPDWSISTTPIELDIGSGYVVFHATIANGEGRVMAEATKMETAKGFGDYVEKAETGAIGRALAMCGFGTQFAPELDEGERIVDSPQQRKVGTQPASGNGQPSVEERGKCVEWITKGWKEREAFDAAFKTTARRWNSMQHFAELQGFQAELPEGPPSKAVSLWLSEAPIPDLHAYAKHNAHRLREEQAKAKEAA